MAKQVASEEVAKRLQNGEGVTVIDVRERNEIVTGKISGAMNIPLGQLVLRKDELDKDKSYIITCQSGNRSKAACGILEALGYKVENLVGGLNSWNDKME